MEEKRFTEIKFSLSKTLTKAPIIGIGADY